MAAHLPDAEEVRAIVREELRQALADLRRAGAAALGDELTVEEAAAQLGVAPKTVRRWAREGRLRGTRRGRAWRFDRAGLVLDGARSPEAAALAALSLLPR